MLKILIADDEVIERLVLEKKLRRLYGSDCAILVAQNGREVLEIYRQEHPQILILDIEMPVTTGLEAARAIRRTDSELDVLLDGTWAPTDRHFRFRPSFADDGDFVLEGEVPDSRSVEILTLDACGATWPRTLAFGADGKVSHPSHNVVTTTHEVRSLTTAKKGGGWTFRLVLDASGWGGDKAKRPAWLRVRCGGTPIWPELNPAPEARLNIGNVTPDLFGRIETSRPD